MNCVANASLQQGNHLELSSVQSFYISEKPPPNFILPDDITCQVYHPRTLDGSICDIISQHLQSQIIDFVNVNDCTDSGNITELSIESFNRILSTPSFLGFLIKDKKIIGTMFTLVFRACYQDHPSKEPFEFLTSYTTFLCIAKSFREKGLAMALIRSIMKAGHDRYGIHHGYYMTADTHHTINNKIESWYRPLNIRKTADSGFVLETFARKGDRAASIRQKLAYHINKPNNLPVRIMPSNFKDKSSFLSASDAYERVLKIFHKGDLYLKPTLQEFECLCQCFDVYITDADGFFMLFPMNSLISSTRKHIHNAQLALMIGDAMNQALWAANESGYDLLYGWCGGDITATNVKSVRGLITTATSYLEFYNTRKSIPNNRTMLPIF